jgi:hypothetical protein
MVQKLHFDAKATRVENDHVPLTVALIAVTVLFYSAKLFQYHGYAWADDICLTVPVLCVSPHWIGFAAMAAMACYLFSQAAKS